MNPAAARRIPLVVALMVAVGALATSFLSYQLMLMGSDSMVPRLLLPDPVGWPFGRFINPLSIGATALTLIVLSGLTWLFARLVSRAVLPGRGAAVFFGVWGAVMVAAWISGIIRAPFLVAVLGIPVDQADYYWPQLAQLTTTGASWALTWGWIAAAVAAIIHRARGVNPASAPLAATPYPAMAAPPYTPTPYPPTPTPYPPTPTARPEPVDGPRQAPAPPPVAPPSV